jgi:hypothetical protein
MKMPAPFKTGEQALHFQLMGIDGKSNASSGEINKFFRLDESASSPCINLNDVHRQVGLGATGRQPKGMRSKVKILRSCGYETAG